MARIRSPNYPALSLKEAVQRIGQVFERERQHPASRDVIMKGMGYSGAHGASLSAISAVRKYGLLRQEGDDYRVTDLAVAILHPHNPEEKAEALRKAAFSPPLFAELLSHYKGDIPSDDNLRAYLVRRGFGQAALAGVIQSFRETMELVGSIPSGYTRPAPLSEEDEEEIEEEPGVTPATQQTREVRMRELKPLRVAIEDNQLQVSAVLADAEAVDRLIEILMANKALLPTKAQKQ